MPCLLSTAMRNGHIVQLLQAAVHNFPIAQGPDTASTLTLPWKLEPHTESTNLAWVDMAVALRLFDQHHSPAIAGLGTQVHHGSSAVTTCSLATLRSASDLACLHCACPMPSACQTLWPHKLPNPAIRKATISAKTSRLDAN